MTWWVCHFVAYCTISCYLSGIIWQSSYVIRFFDQNPKFKRPSWFFLSIFLVPSEDLISAPLLKFRQISWPYIGALIFISTVSYTKWRLKQAILTWVCRSLYSLDSYLLVSQQNSNGSLATRTTQQNGIPTQNSQRLVIHRSHVRTILMKTTQRS